MSNSKSEWAAITALALGIIGGLAPFTYFLMALGFLSLPGIIFAIIGWRNTKSLFSKISLGVNIAAVAILISFIVIINYSDYKSSKTVYEYYLPKDFSGWAMIKENRKNSPPIKMIPDSPGGRYLIVFPDSGIISTSSSFNDWHTSKYFRYDERDTIQFHPETGNWEDSTYKSFIHCEGGSTDIEYFYVSDIPRRDDDSIIINAYNTLDSILIKNK